jgi:hypothetical protein
MLEMQNLQRPDQRLVLPKSLILLFLFHDLFSNSYEFQLGNIMNFQL